MMVVKEAHVLSLLSPPHSSTIDVGDAMHLVQRQATKKVVYFPIYLPVGAAPHRRLSSEGAIMDDPRSSVLCTGGMHILQILAVPCEKTVRRSLSSGESATSAVAAIRISKRETNQNKKKKKKKKSRNVEKKALRP